MIDEIPTEYCILDIETAPLKDVARKMCKPYPKFDPENVSLGNAKKPETIAEKLAEARIEHEKPETEQAHYDKYANKLAGLVPQYSEICAIGLKIQDSDPLILGSEMTERQAIEYALKIMSNRTYKIVGHSLYRFDLRMIFGRAAMLKINIPYGLQSWRGLYPSYPERFISIERYLTCGRSITEMVSSGEQWSLSYMAKLHGVARTREYDVEGKTFHEYYRSEDAHKVSQAIQYLKDDLLETEAVYLCYE